ncbi:uncharacterized protein LY79DRAFT_142223 [Colletotrichum navitas]|uniref:Uncharacterized protein n=1 Tax=Colletotrichum navitas TaxID=681940 RepID=A0AAD8QBE1_9PEZI|nr:uncharacterized protein LY79DRAFT_142223 [Colletotrichum navitas]KAK1599490.1 hypothetical protein LY79DRAFT_142223 [Colletotrichum navitas]
MHHPLPASAAWTNRVPISERGLDCSKGGVFLDALVCLAALLHRPYICRGIYLHCVLVTPLCRAACHLMLLTNLVIDARIHGISLPGLHVSFDKATRPARKWCQTKLCKLSQKSFSVAVVSGAREAGNVSSNRGRLTSAHGTSPHQPTPAAASIVSGDHHPPLR